MTSRPANLAYLFAVLLLPFTAGFAHAADPLDNVAAKLAKGAGHHALKIAVFNFSYPDGDVSSGSSIVAEELTTLMVGRKNIVVIERSQLSRMLSEMKLELSGVTVSTGTQKLGQVLGVDAIVTGSLADIEPQRTMLNARLIECATGEVLSAAAATIDRTWSDSPRPPHSPDEEVESRYMSPLIPVHQARRPRPPPVWQN